MFMENRVINFKGKFSKIVLGRPFYSLNSSIEGIELVKIS
jgi:hypothetical protein